LKKATLTSKIEQAGKDEPKTKTKQRDDTREAQTSRFFFSLSFRLFLGQWLLLFLIQTRFFSYFFDFRIMHKPEAFNKFSIASRACVPSGCLQKLPLLSRKPEVSVCA
jgi:hypothetical protein